MTITQTHPEPTATPTRHIPQVPVVVTAPASGNTPADDRSGLSARIATGITGTYSRRLLIVAGVCALAAAAAYGLHLNPAGGTAVSVLAITLVAWLLLPGHVEKSVTDRITAASDRQYARFATTVTATGAEPANLSQLKQALNHHRPRPTA